MTFSFHPEAEIEFVKAVEYYENCERGLGEDFALEVYSTIEHILTHPVAWPVIGRYSPMPDQPVPVRRALQRRT